MNTKKLAANAVIAAAYATLTIALAPISYGALQLRLSEALCILPALIPGASWGLFVGCAIANLLSPIGPVDVILGSAATLMAALCSEQIAKSEFLKYKENDAKQGLSITKAALICFMPVIWNAAIIGAMIAVASMPAGGFWKSFTIFALQVGGGEAAVMYIIGMPLLIFLPKSRTFKKAISSLGTE
ncbi:MAG: QueT transporter family protein [Ruminococcaceae bacterium]|nr:QueT transporter family protein [Oscillospiraceae bacterium]